MGYNKYKNKIKWVIKAKNKLPGTIIFYAPQYRIRRNFT